MHTYKCTCIYVCSSQSNIDRGSTGEVPSLNSITRHLYTLIGGYDLASLTTRAQTSFMLPQHFVAQRVPGIDISHVHVMLYMSIIIQEC